MSIRGGGGPEVAPAAAAASLDKVLASELGGGGGLPPPLITGGCPAPSLNRAEKSGGAGPSCGETASPAGEGEVAWPVGETGLGRNELRLANTL